ncbi:FAD-dependent oxidoreductase [Caballeronia ptereochthonis]|uniref:3-oxosteroid 1-dehydrogenase n=1 Tax=Caballeronia ptereochthonis TaxID=1777144 RepID=A0A158CCD7_9BURK|nr:FAD-dependent oxidoreductase [Caballeronia ptereochthonis]SAK79969.1 3-oxosteroid 1-dehydrogenase [Caballeronia ptereochthonis]
MTQDAISADVAIVGGGLAGLVAANRLAELGLSAVVLEAGEDALYPANSRYAGGVFHIAFRDLDEAPQALADAIADASAGLRDPSLAEALARDGARVVHWLAAHGGAFGRGGEYPFMGNMLMPFSLRETGFQNHWRGKGCDRLLQALESAFVAAGGRVVRGARARDLDVSQGRCTGVIAQTRDGGRLAVRAHAVLLADGGFQGNAEMVREHISPRPEHLCKRGAGTGLGDGIRMARAAGAALTGMDRFYGHVQHKAALHSESLWPYPVLDIVASCAIVVDADGRRFTDEGLGGVALANAIAALDEPLSSFVVLDEAIWETAGRAFLLAPNPALEELGAVVHRAAGIDALAAETGMDARTLAHSIDTYNGALEQGRLASLQPPRTVKPAMLAGGAAPIRGPRHIAIPLCAGMTYTMGGIVIDADARALDAHDRPVPGLYAAGATTGGIEGGANSGYVGGLIKAAVFGLRAAEAAARDEPA